MTRGTPRMHVCSDCWRTSSFVTSSLHVQIARQINKKHGGPLQAEFLIKLDTTLDKELLHSIPKGKEW